MPSQGSDVPNAENGIGAHLTLDGEVVLHHVAGLVLVVDAACSADRIIAAPVNRVVGIAGGDLVGRHSHRKLLNVMRAGKCANKWSFHDGRFRAGISQTIWGVPRGVSNREALRRGKEAPCTQTDTR